MRGPTPTKKKKSIDNNNNNNKTPHYAVNSACIAWATCAGCSR
jgi:hypothetical protein